jgi:hypothetical protein
VLRETELRVALELGQRGLDEACGELAVLVEEDDEITDADVATDEDGAHPVGLYRGHCILAREARLVLEQRDDVVVEAHVRLEIARLLEESGPTPSRARDDSEVVRVVEGEALAERALCVAERAAPRVGEGNIGAGSLQVVIGQDHEPVVAHHDVGAHPGGAEGAQQCGHDHLVEGLEVDRDLDRYDRPPFRRQVREGLGGEVLATQPEACR